MAIIDLYAKGRHYFVIAEEKNEPTYKIEKTRNNKPQIVRSICA